MKNTTLVLFALAVISFSTSCARGSGCYYNNVEQTSTQEADTQNSTIKFSKVERTNSEE